MLLILHLLEEHDGHWVGRQRHRGVEPCCVCGILEGVNCGDLISGMVDGAGDGPVLTLSVIIGAVSGD